MHIVECDPDVILVSSLASISVRRIVHAGGKHQVLRRLLKQRDSIGMIDEDPLSIQPRRFLQKFVEIDNLERDKLKILHYAQGNDRLIVLCPRLEEWIVETCRVANVELRRHNLPDDPIRLHGIINFRLNRFQRLVEDLIRQSDRVRTLRDRLTEPI